MGLVGRKWHGVLGGENVKAPSRPTCSVLPTLSSFVFTPAARKKKKKKKKRAGGMVRVCVNGPSGMVGPSPAVTVWKGEWGKWQRMVGGCGAWGSARGGGGAQQRK